jgi:Rab3 GTPase-activating protein catalytic subunit
MLNLSFLSQVPVFVQIHAPEQHYYMGVCEGKGIRSEFEMVHLKRTPSHYRYLTGKVIPIILY